MKMSEIGNWNEWSFSSKRVHTKVGNGFNFGVQKGTGPFNVQPTCRTNLIGSPTPNLVCLARLHADNIKFTELLAVL